MWPFAKKSKTFPPKNQVNAGDEWTVAAAIMNGVLTLISIRKNASDIKGHPEYQFQVGVATPLNNPNEQGFYTPEEGALLSAIEDQLTGSLEQDNESVFVLSNCCKGAREWVFYTGNPDLVKSHFLRIRDATKTHALQLLIRPDPEWSVFDAYASVTKGQNGGSQPGR
jgi:hypothetical protein